MGGGSRRAITRPPWANKGPVSDKPQSSSSYCVWSEEPKFRVIFSYTVHSKLACYKGPCLNKQTNKQRKSSQKTASSVFSFRSHRTPGVGPDSRPTELPTVRFWGTEKDVYLGRCILPEAIHTYKCNLTHLERTKSYPNVKGQLPHSYILSVTWKLTKLPYCVTFLTGLLNKIFSQG